MEKEIWVFQTILTFVVLLSRVLVSQKEHSQKLVSTCSNIGMDTWINLGTNKQTLCWPTNFTLGESHNALHFALTTLTHILKPEALMFAFKGLSIAHAVAWGPLSTNPVTPRSHLWNKCTIPASFGQEHRSCIFCRVVHYLNRGEIFKSHPLVTKNQIFE